MTSKEKRKVQTERQYGGNTRESKGVSRRKRRGIPSVSVLENYVKRSVIGQDDAIRRIVTAIYKAIKFKSIKTNLLVVGGSGTGKTEIITQIANRLKIPYTIEDATKYTKEGYYGSDVDDMIYNLIDNAGHDIEKAQRGLLIIDEIDKKATPKEYGQDISGSDVLKSMLRLIQGTKIKISNSTDAWEENLVDFDTSNLIVIFMRAFDGLEEIKGKRLGKGIVGFTKAANESTNLSKRFTKDDLNKYGMPEEFVGRLDTVVETRKLTVDDLESILRNSKLSIFRRYQKELRDQGICLVYNGKLLRKIAEASLNMGTGARELSNTVNYVFENIIHDVFDAPEGKYRTCVLSDDIVDDNTKYNLS